MSKKECPSCAMPVNKKDRVCPICGYEFPVSGYNNVKWIALALAILFLLFLLF